MTKQQKLAAQRFAAWLRTIPNHLWDISEFLSGPSCGATGCAIGHGLVHGMIPGYTNWK